MATYGSILELIELNKADNSGITAAEDRQVDIAILDFIKDNIPILKGVKQIGDVSPTDQSITITFPDIGTSSYYVIGTLKGNSSNFDTDNDVFWLFERGLRSYSKFILLLGVKINIKWQRE